MSFSNVWTVPRFAVALVVLAILAADVGSAENIAPSNIAKPNVLVILADDLGHGDVACYNDQSKVKTPNLDRMAREGMRFIDAHSPCTVCTPTRYSLMTGQMAFRVPRGGTVFTGAGGPSLIADSRLTVAEMMRDHGYATSCIGKWHIGMSFFDSDGKPLHRGGLEPVKRIDYSRRIVGGPLDHGFDHFFGTVCCPTTDWLYAYIDGDRIPNPPTQQLDRTNLPKHPYANDNRPGMVADDFDVQEVDERFLQASKSWIDGHMKDSPEQPFFLVHCTQAVHLPSFPGKRFRGTTKAGPHGDFIAQLDQTVGDLLNHLKAHEIDDETLVIFSSDNGPEVDSIYYMRHDYQHDGARPWRGIKRDNWEGGHRVPLLVRWPGMIPTGSTSDQLVSLTDVMATLADIVDHQLPEQSAEDSFSWLPIFQQTATEPIRPYLLMQGFGGDRYLAIRQGDWKYLAHKGSGGNRYPGHRLLKEYFLEDTQPDAPGQLYNLKNDPGETENLVVSHAEIAGKLSRLLEQTKQTGRSRGR
ncbi:MAG: arylsulfatase [Rhodopirellula sp. TMED11]|nr:MAG: arylsulfatase [Rhodopirellula sp. TMED11]